MVTKLSLWLELLAKDTERAIASTVENPEIDAKLLEVRKKRLDADLEEANTRVAVALNSRAEAEATSEEVTARIEAAKAASSKARAEREEAEAKAAKARLEKAKANAEHTKLVIERKKQQAHQGNKPPHPRHKSEIEHRREERAAPLTGHIKGLENVKLEDKAAEK
jgi:RNA-splicing ligase RtcB